LLTGLAVHAGCVEEGADCDPVADAQGDLLGTELGLRDLVLIELPDRHRHTVQDSGYMLRPVQSDQRRVDRVLRPAVWRRPERLSYGGACGAASDSLEHLPAYWVVF